MSMRAKGLHDGIKSRKWWGLLILFLLLVWGALNLSITAYGVFAPTALAGYATFCGFNITEKVLGTGGLLKGLGLVKEDSRGDEHEI